MESRKKRTRMLAVGTILLAGAAAVLGTAVAGASLVGWLSAIGLAVAALVLMTSVWR